jgi:predicted dehydrogenase
MIKPYILGSGLSGKAVARSLHLLSTVDKDYSFAEPLFVPRDASLKEYAQVAKAKTLLVIANPDALHTPRLLEAVESAFDLIVCEKPTSSDAVQLRQLQHLSLRIPVLHVYRQLWGPQHMRSIINEGKLGDIVAIEGKMWQSSKAVKLSPSNINKPTKPWRTDASFTGPHGVSLGLGTHWLDMAMYLAGCDLTLSGAQIDNRHGAHAGDDTYFHIQLKTEYGAFVAGSICNMAHGSTNDLEITVVGTQASVSWRFMQPDEIIFSQGYTHQLLYRATADIGSHLPPFHGLGWIEGYMEIIRQSIREMLGLSFNPYPTLQESNKVIGTLIAAIELASENKNTSKAA